MTNLCGKLLGWSFCFVLVAGISAPAQTSRKRSKPRTAKAKTTTPKPATAAPTSPPATRAPVAEPAPASEGSIFNLTPRRVEPTPAPAPANLKPVAYKLRGKVLEVYRKPLQATVEHEEIVGYMGPMAMKFPLKDPLLADTLKPGDLIEATLLVSQTDGAWWLENVVVKKDKQ